MQRRPCAGVRASGGAAAHHLLLCAALLAVAACGERTNAPRQAPGAENTGAPLPAAPAREPVRPVRAFWGDLHVHSRYSFDSFSFGNRSLGPEEAYRFARGEAVPAHNGTQARLRRPLDFLLVSDHAEFLGVLPRLAARDEGLLGSEFGARWSEYLGAGNVAGITTEYIAFIQRREKPAGVSAAFEASVWHELGAIAERFNEPGRFTAFIGYEWTSMIDGANLHRNVLFRDGTERTDRITPFSALDSPDPEDLWDYLAHYERETGGSALAIPHNGNLSNGAMFADLRVSGEPLGAAYAEARARWEPVYEVTQVKGDSESHAQLSPADEFAGYETWDQGDITMQPKRPGMLGGEYARPALLRGLQYQQEIGANPFRFGLVGGTDSHTALATADEDNFFGKFPDSEPGPERLRNRMGGRLWENRRLAASGYTAVWATDNTREALFDALRRREAYASTGPRITVRFFGGWDFVPGDLQSADFVERAYARGVPMGSELKPRGTQAAPRFLVMATRDPSGANLDRVQIVKGWIGDAGRGEERVYDVALSDGRSAGLADGRIPPVGSTVDATAATYTNTIGAAELGSVWTDPDFDPRKGAFYYARVLEIPTPRWTTYDAARFGAELPADVPRETQERAYTSAIWYTPADAALSP